MEQHLETYRINSYKVKKIENDYLLISPHGSWILLSSEEYEFLQENSIPKNLFKKLENKGIVVTKNNKEKITLLLRDKYSHLFSGIFLHDIFIDGLTKDTAKDIISFIFTSPSENMLIQIHGNDFEIIKTITEAAKKSNTIAQKKYGLHLFSDLSFCNEEILIYLKQNEIGITTEINNPWIKKIHQKNIGHYILSKVNCKDLGNSKLFLEQCIEKGIKEFKLLQGDCSAQEFINYWKKIMDTIIKKRYSLQEINTKIFLGKMQGIWFNYIGKESPCSCGIGKLAYSAEGKIYSCEYGLGKEMFQLGDVAQPYEEVTTSNVALNLASASLVEGFISEDYPYSPYLGLCPAQTYKKRESIWPILSKNDEWYIQNNMLDYLFRKIVLNEDIKTFLMKR